MSETTSAKTFGKPVPRLEDPPLLRGEGRFLDDLRPADCLAVAFLRSPYAHARFTKIDTADAVAMTGVVAVYTLEDLRPYLAQDRLVVALPSASIRHPADRPILATGEVVHVGEPVALVVAETRAEAEDAADVIDVDFEPLEAVSDCRDALAEGAPRVHTALPDNLLARFDFDYGDCDAALAKAAHTVTGSYWVHRGGAHSLEGRGVLASFDAARDLLEVWSSTQTPYALKRHLCDMLMREEDAVSVATPDLGGGFGPKLVTYPEEIAIGVVALKLGRPVKWVEDRSEHFVGTTQERDQHWAMEAAFDDEGHILAVRGHLLHDHGAYTARGLNVPYGSAVTVPLPYNVPAYHLDIDVALTNKVPTTPIRGAGQPQGAFVMERLLDLAAKRIGLSREEIRRRNLVRPDQMPCRKPLRLRGGTDIILDSGDYPATQANAMLEAGWDTFEARRSEARARGRRLGIGLANYVEATGRGPYEQVTVRIARSGRIVITTGASAMGQGTATMLAQIVGEQFGGNLDLVTVRTGETHPGTLGFGGFNSRQTVVAGASAHAAAREVRSKLLTVAAHMLECRPDELDVTEDGHVSLPGLSNRTLSFAEIARAADGLPGYTLPGIETPGLQARGSVVTDDMVYSNGCAVAEVEVDPDTGAITVHRFTIAHDCGRMVNPMTVDGQVVGGIAHGLGNALFEWMGFDESAQPITATFADYVLISAAEMPEIEVIHTQAKSPFNELGVKGVGESGVIPTTAAIASAVDDALRDLDVHVERMPMLPQVLRRIIKDKTAQAVHADA
ncbi:xanthine dehydrogenase family protein molybdopterin-binding subunit [Amorphus sp. 3PC139-8]|uniref:xanthine dehydrogenase family protein molybdopterin-binding subunit n=1 Tax=Amorphus sp. 3PC139-8 TaxID=2735676 RepID=UPI00345C6F30